MVFQRRGLFITAVLFLSTDSVLAFTDTKIMTSNAWSSALERDNVSRNLRDADGTEKEERASFSGFLSRLGIEKRVDDFFAKSFNMGSKKDAKTFLSDSSFKKFYDSTKQRDESKVDEEVFKVLTSKFPEKDVAHMLSLGQQSRETRGIAEKPGVISDKVLGVRMDVSQESIKMSLSAELIGTKK